MENSANDIMLRILQVWLGESDYTLKSLYAIGVQAIQKSLESQEPIQEQSQTGNE